jgi:hypothetical protein
LSAKACNVLAITGPAIQASDSFTSESTIPVLFHPLFFLSTSIVRHDATSRSTERHKMATNKMPTQNHSNFLQPRRYAHVRAFFNPAGRLRFGFEFNASIRAILDPKLR